MKFFFSALDRFAEINTDIPVTISPLYTQYESFPARYDISVKIRETGLTVAEMPLSSEASRKTSNPRNFWANPVDGHPNRYLNELYAKDIVATLLRNHPWMLDAPAGKQRLRPLVSNYLPLGGETIGSNDLAFSGTLTSDFVATRVMILPDGTQPAEQKTPCAILGRAHGALYLRNGLPVGQRFELSLQSATDTANIVDVYTSHVDQNSKVSTRKVGELRAGDSVMFTLENGERTILIAPRNGGECGDSEAKILLPPLRIELYLR
jgi:hypothetical protein